MKLKENLSKRYLKRHRRKVYCEWRRYRRVSLVDIDFKHILNKINYHKKRLPSRVLEGSDEEKIPEKVSRLFERMFEDVVNLEANFKETYIIGGFEITFDLRYGIVEIRKEDRPIAYVISEDSHLRRASCSYLTSWKWRLYRFLRENRDEIKRIINEVTLRGIVVAI